MHHKFKIAVTIIKIYNQTVFLSQNSLTIFIYIRDTPTSDAKNGQDAIKHIERKKNTLKLERRKLSSI